MKDDDFDYRVKFTDIRVKKGGRKGAAAREAETRICDYEGCQEPGIHPAPKRVGDGKFYFCKRHAAEYNKSFNFFDTMNEEEYKEFQENARYGFTPTWKMGAGPMGGSKAASSHDPKTWRGREFFEQAAEAREARRNGQRKATGVAARALGELDLDPDAKPAEIRARYSELVRAFHPDSNGGDRSTEQKLARVIRAGKTLKAAGLMKD